MKTLGIFLVLCGVSFAQTFTIVTDDTVQAGAPTLYSDVIAKAYVTNVTASKISLNVHRTLDSLPSDWATSMCVGIQCFGATVDNCSFSNIKAGVRDSFLLHFLPSAAPGRGDVTVVFTDYADTSSTVTLHFHFTTNGTTQFNITPTTIVTVGTLDTLTWSTDLTGTARLEFSTDAGEGWSLIDSAVDLSAKQYYWTPTLKSNIAKLRFVAPAGHFLSDMFRVTQPVGVREQLPESQALQLSPNPAGAVASLRSMLPVEQVVIVDVLGREVTRQSYSSGGTLSALLDLATLPAGAYHVIARTRSSNFSLPLFVVK